MPLTLRQVTSANDPAGVIGGHEVFLVPTAALVVGASYNVGVAGTVDGVGFAKQFTFKTAP